MNFTFRIPVRSAVPFTAALCGALAAGVSLPKAVAVDFTKEVAPILQTRCLDCHGPEKQKGKLRLDTREDLLKGGKEGEVIKAGDESASELYKRVALPKDDDKHMPPKGDPLTSEQLATLKAWIKDGAKWPDGFVIKAEAPAAPAPAPAVAAAATPAAPPRPAVPPPERPKDFKPEAAEAGAIDALAKRGVDVRPVAQGVPWREVNLRLLGTNVTDETIAPLKEIKSLIEVRLGTTRVTDAGLAVLGSLPYLEVVGLELTGVTDAGVEKLKGLSNLASLNLYGTAVTDAALPHLSGMKHLRNLYLWQTKVTPEGVKKLQECLPGLDINTGPSLTPPSTNAPAAAPTAEAKK